MVIRELYIKNFGKFRERHFYLKDGVQVISGENEFGKSTLHAFIRVMLFGLWGWRCCGGGGAADPTAEAAGRQSGALGSAPH